MKLMEIILLIIGVGAFILSFILPEKKGKNGMDIDMDAFNALMEKEMKEARQKVEEIVDETVEYAVEKTERASERISNEKIMAINDYSETVLEDVNKAHQEVMFLYDMLNDKHKNLKETVKEAQSQAKQVEEKTKEAKEAKEAIDAKTMIPSSFTEKMPTFMPSLKEKSDKIEVYSFAEQAPKYEKVKATEFKPLNIAPTQAVKMEETVSAVLPEEPVLEENNNDKILRLSRTGMSSVDIAKELGLGVGEVKLVLNLFKGAV